MAAQPGNSVLLQYGAQGAQQPGSTILLNYNAPAVGGGPVQMGLSTLAHWHASRTKRSGLDARYPADKTADHGRDANWTAARPKSAGKGSPWVKADRRDRGRDAPWSPFGVTFHGNRSSGWPRAARRDDQRTGPWGQYGEMLNEDRGGKWAESLPADAFKRGVFGSFWIPTYVPIPYARPPALAAHFAVAGGTPLAIILPVLTEAIQRLPLAIQFPPESYTPHFTGLAERTYFAPYGRAADFHIDENATRQLLVDEFGNPILRGSNRDAVRLNPWGIGKRQDDTTIIPWLRFSRPLNPGWGIVVPGGPPVPVPGETIIIPVKRVYIVVNELFLGRADDNTPIPASNLSIQFDCDSWLPSFTATIPESARDTVMPDPGPVEVYAFINGSEFRFFVEKIARSRQFANRSVSISGRGIACELDAPFATASQHTNIYSVNAQQIIDAALEYTGYTQTWNIDDWVVPSGAFSLFGTPAAVAGHVAEASGSVLAADWQQKDLRMLPRYPVLPWNWGSATPEYVIPAAITQTESVEWIEKPDYNVVYVAGVQAGVLGQVKISGTAGDKPAPMVTHPLITHLYPARARGGAILSDTGRKAMMQISMPVLPSTGVIDICRMIEFNDGANTRRGIVRANNVSANWPTVRQTLTIEAAA